MRILHRLLITLPIFVFLLAQAAADASAQEPLVRFGCPAAGACNPTSTLEGVEAAASIFIVPRAVSGTSGTVPKLTLYTFEGRESRNVELPPLQTIHFTTDPITHWYVGLLDSGQLIVAHPELTNNIGYLFGGQSLRDMALDSSPLVYNAATRRTDIDPASIQHQLATYRDIAIWQEGEQISLFVTGITNRRQFVLRIRFNAPFVLYAGAPNNIIPSIKAVVTSTAPAEADVPAGIAAPPPPNELIPTRLRNVLTTLPVCAPDGSQETCAAPHSVAVSFDPDTPEGLGRPPAWGRAMASRGMAADGVGNFYVATGPAGAAGCPDSGLVMYSRDLSYLVCFPPAGDASTGPGIYHDVGVSWISSAAYVPVTFETDPGAVYRYIISSALAVGVSYAAQSADFDGDGKTDLAVRRSTQGSWFVIESSTDRGRLNDFGVPSALPVPGDFNGDGKTDLAVWSPLTGEWSILESSSPLQVRSRGWGAPGDIPVPADYDGDGKCDLAVWRPADGAWFVLESSTGLGWGRGWGAPGDLPVPGDYDGDGKADLAVWRPADGAWFIIDSSTGTGRGRGWGAPGDIPVPADYDGDGKTDIAVWRGTQGAWFIINSSTGSTTARGWGSQSVGDYPVPADYDGDGKADLAVWRGTTDAWFIISSSTGATSGRSWGVEALGDSPVSSHIIRK